MKLDGLASALELPLLRKELRALLRTRLAFWVLLGSVAATALVPLLVWPRSVRGDVWTANVLVFQLFLWTQLGVSLLAVPAFTAGAISGERERGTYDLLHATLLGPRRFVVSKALASIACVVLLIVAIAPVAIVLYLLGGIGFDTILHCYAVTLASIVAAGLVCLAQSMRAERTSRATVLGAVWVGFWNVGLFVALWIIFLALGSGVWGSAARTVRTVIFASSPFGVIYLEVWDLARPLAIGGGLVLRPWSLFLIYAAIISASQLAFLLRAAGRPDAPSSWLRRLVERRERGGRRGQTGPRRIRNAWTARLLARLGERVPALRNPVFLREIRSELYGRPLPRRLAFYGFLILYGGWLFAFMVPGCSREHLFTLAGVLSSFLLGALIPAVCASSFTRELEQGSLDLLRGTPLTPLELLKGKLFAALYATGGIVAAAVITLPLAYASPFPPWEPASYVYLMPLRALAAILLSWIAMTSVSISASALSRTTLRASVLAYGTLSLLYIVAPSLVGLLVKSRWRLREAILEAIHPFGIACAFEPYARDVAEIPRSLLRFCAVQLGIAGICLGLTLYRLNRVWGRDR